MRLFSHFFTKTIIDVVKVIFIYLLLIFLISGCGGCGGGSSSGDSSRNSSVLTWDAPTTNDDGTPLIALAGYKIYYGTSPGHYSTVIDVGNLTRYKVKNLRPGTYYFAVTAYNIIGNESIYSNEVSKKIE
jgi:hypothetical protein